MRHRRQRGWWACRPGLESLEGRRLPAQFGVPWHDATHLSISFVPDGTPIAGHRSDLFAALGAREPSAVWQREILQAFQTWAVQADVNFAVVPDGGEPLGTPGPDQHDPRFGDIRIGAQPMSPEVLSISVPHDPFLSGTWSGDVLLNSDTAFDGGGARLFPVLLHEVGHVLGLDDSNDPNSVMFPHLDNARDTLSPADIAAVRALYGPRTDDPLPAAPANPRFPAASLIPAPAGFDGSTPLFLYAGLQAAGDSSVLELDAPAGYSGPATVRLQTEGVSLLAPRLTVYDADGKVVVDVASRNGTGDTLQVRLPEVGPGRTYFLQVRGATGGIFGVGEYALSVNFDARSTVSPDAIDGLARQSYSYLSPDDINAIFLDPKDALFHKDGHTNDTFATAEPLLPAGGYGTEAPDRVTASLGDPTDVDVYQIEAPDEPAFGPARNADRPLVMTVTGRATEVNGLMPVVAVFDGVGRPVPAVVLAHGDGTFTIQVADTTPGEGYFIRVSADPGSGKVVGNYDLDVEYGHTAATPATFVESTAGGQVVQEDDSLVVNEAQLFDFMLAADPGLTPPGAGVRMTLSDRAGRTVLTRTAGAGRTEGGDPVLLAPGVYRVSFTAEGPGFGQPPFLAFRLFGASLTDPIGPALDDPTLNPVAVGSPADPSVPALPAIGSSDNPYTWLAISLSDPSSTFAARQGTGVVGISGLRNGPASLIAQDRATLAPTNAVPSDTAATLTARGQDSAPAPSAPGRPPQSSVSRGAVLSALTVALQGSLAGTPGLVHPLDAAAFPVPLSEGVAAREGRPPAPVPPPDESEPGHPLPSPERSGEGRTPTGPGAGPPPAARADLFEPSSRLAPAVLIVGAVTAAYGYWSRTRLVPFGVRRPFPLADRRRPTVLGVSAPNREPRADGLFADSGFGSG